MVLIWLGFFMITVYPLEKYFSFEIQSNFDLFGTWFVKKDVQKWLDTNCMHKWRISSDVEFTWSLYDKWMNTRIDECMNIVKLPSDPLVWPFAACRPNIIFDSVKDAILFRLTF